MSYRSTVLPAALFVTLVVACAEGEAFPPTGAATGTGASGGDGGAGQGASGAGASGPGAGGTAQGGMGTGGTGTGGMAQGGMGTGGDGGMGTGGMGTGGEGGMGGSMGTGGGAPTGGSIVAVVGRGLMNAQSTEFVSGQGWSSPAALNLFVKSASLAPDGAGAVAVMRRQSANMAEDNELFWSTWSNGSFSNPTTVGTFGFGAAGPAAAQHGVALLMSFLGTDNKHYFAQKDGGAFGAFTALPGGMMGTQAFGPSTSALVSDGVAVYAAYAGDDSNLYYLVKTGPGSSFGLSTQVPGTSALNKAIPPVGMITASDDLALFYVRQVDGRICRITLDLPANVWGAELVVHTNAITDRTPAVAVTADGDQVVAWHGSGDNGIYATRGNASFVGPTTVDAPMVPTVGPVALTGVGGTADAELLYLEGGALQHVRVNGNTYPVSSVAGLTGLTNVAATVVP